MVPLTPTSEVLCWQKYPRLAQLVRARDLCRNNSIGRRGGDIAAQLQVRVLLSAPNREVPCSIHGARTKYAPLAQLVEHMTFNHGVSGSSPGRRTTGWDAQYVEKHNLLSKQPEYVAKLLFIWVVGIADCAPDC